MMMLIHKAITRIVRKKSLTGLGSSGGGFLSSRQPLFPGRFHIRDPPWLRGFEHSKKGIPGNSVSQTFKAQNIVRVPRLY